VPHKGVGTVEFSLHRGANCSEWQQPSASVLVDVKILCKDAVHKAHARQSMSDLSLHLVLLTESSVPKLVGGRKHHSLAVSARCAQVEAGIRN